MTKHAHPVKSHEPVEDLGAVFLPGSLKSTPRPVSKSAGSGNHAAQHADKIAIKSNGRIHFIHPIDVILAQAQGSYVTLQCEGGSYRLRESISEVAAKLEPYGFVRIHRSVLINSSWVQEIHLYAKGDYGLRLRTGKEIAVTRAYRHNLGLLADLWF
jgi:DNA-binding LytR/AlgR family response regulator